MPIEKPGTSPPAGRRWLALSGVYDFPMSLGQGRLADVVATLAKSARGEVEVTFLLERFWHYGLLDVEEHVGSWIDAGEPDGYRTANDPAFWPPGVTERA
jgi:dTDP-glucose pyrophosphorylase